MNSAPPAGGAAESPTPPVTVNAGDWVAEHKGKQRPFPVPSAPADLLRVAFMRDAFADLCQHTKESLHAEVCGVLVGVEYGDKAGPWLDVRAVIRGAAAAQGSDHVTFTQETWTRIHEERERRHPKLHILGWYHSHPGFGVEFSEMDTFIHRNFFPAATQLAFLNDPASGDDAACINSADGIRYLDRVYVDGKERALNRPRQASAGAPADGQGSPRIEVLESRLGQLISSIDDIQERITRFYMIVGMVVVMGFALFIAYHIWLSYATRYEPPRLLNHLSMPLHIGDKDIMVQLEVVGWDVPPELDSILMRMAREKFAEAEAKLKAEAEKAEKSQKAENAEKSGKSGTDGGTDAPAPAPAPAPPAPPHDGKKDQ